MFWKLATYTKSVAVPLIEGYLRWRDRIGLAMLKLSGKSTVVDVQNADRLTSDRVVIFAAYPTEKLASFHIRFLEKWERRGYCIIIASHHPRATEILRPLAERGWCVIRRRPFGRDFGCYRDASRLLYDLQDSGQANFSRIVYINDSVITVDTAEEQIISYIDAPSRHFVGITDNYDRGYHISSYMFGISGQVFRERRVRDYWRTYGAVSTRRYAISKGEIGFSRCITKTGYIPHVQWPIAKLKSRLERLDLDRVSMIAEAMEPHFKSRHKHPLIQVNESLDEFVSSRKKLLAEDPAQKLGGLISQFVRSSGNKPQPKPVGGRHMELVDLPNDKQVAVFNRTARDRMTDTIVGYIFRGSHIHHGAAPLLFLGAGVLKKDLVLRRIIEPFNIEKLLLDSRACASHEVDEILMEIVARGHPKSFRGGRALMLRWDFI